MKQEKEYFAFISYKREDEKWAKWLAKELEHYHLPTTLNGKGLPKNLRPIFRDVDDLAAGNLPEQIYHALSISKNLIVVCSPRSAKSKWVNKEIEDFLELKGGKSDNIYPFIIEGAPFSKDAEKECFPENLRNLPNNKERLGGNINEQGGRNAAVVKVIAGMLGIGFDTLWQRYKREKEKERRLLIETNNKILRNFFRFIAEKSISFTEKGDSYFARLLAMSVLPCTLRHADRPYVAEAEHALRKALASRRAVFRGHTSDIIDICFSHSGLYLASSSTDNTIRIWDVDSGNVIHCLIASIGICGPAERVQFSEDDSHLISYDTKTLREWDLLTGQELSADECSQQQAKRIFKDSQLCGSNKKYNIQYDKDKGELSVHDKKNDKVLNCIDCHCRLATAPVISPKDNIIAVGGEDYTIRITELLPADRATETIRGIDGIINTISVSPNGKFLMAASGSDLSCSPNNSFLQILNRNLGIGDSKNTIYIWDMKTKALEQTLIGMPTNDSFSSGCVNAVYLDSHRDILSFTLPDIIQFWNATDEECQFTLDCPNLDGLCVSYDKKNLALVTSEEDSSIMIYNIHDDDVISNWDINQEQHGSLCTPSFSPDGTKIANCAKNTIFIWDIESGTLIHKLVGHTDYVRSLCFSPNSRHIATVSMDHCVRVWDVRSGKCIFMEELFENEGTSVAYSPNGKYIAVAVDKHVVIIEEKTGVIIDELHGHSRAVLVVTFSPDGRFIITGSSDKTIKFWPFPPLQQLINETRERFKDRPLSQEERQKYYLE